MVRIRVSLAEDYPAMQAAIGALIRAEFLLMEIIGAGGDLLDSIAQSTPNVLVLDVSLAGCSGLQLLPQLRRKFPNLGIVILTSHDAAIYRREALARGADAFVSKSAAAGVLAPAIRMALAARQTHLLGSALA